MPEKCETLLAALWAAEKALTTAAVTIDGLAEQQAMPDNWYLSKAHQVLDVLTDVRAVLETHSHQEEETTCPKENNIP